MAFTTERVLADTPTIKRGKLVAKCYSEQCSPSAYGNKPRILNLPMHVDWCPDCRNALVWERVEASGMKDKQ